VLWFLPLLALAVARVVAVPADSRDAFPVVTMTMLVALLITLAGGFLTYLPAVATPYGRRVLMALREGTPAPRQAVADHGGPAAAELRRSVALHGATVLRVADPAMVATLKVPEWSSSSAEAAGGTEFTGVGG
jgi:hypothetical protein